MKATKKPFTDKQLSDRERKNFAILDTIRKKGPIARTEISKLTGFNIVTVSNYIDHYIKKGLIAEEGYDTSSGGRKPMMVDLKQKSASIIGVGFDMMGVTGVVADLRGEILFQIRKSYRVKPGMALIEKLLETAEELLANSLVEKDKVKGIGLAVAGIIDRENNSIRWPGPLGAQDLVISVSLRDKFKSRFGIPLIIENDADCAVFGEQWLSLNPEYKNVLYMYSGVSCGILINGQIYKGASGIAGELGIYNSHALATYDWKKESFGFGRWDMELGMLQNIKELQKKYGNSKIFKSVNDNIEDITFVTILEAAKKDDELALKLLTKGGEDLGRKVAFLVNLFNPQIVVIGGGIERAGSLIIDPLKKTVKEWAFEEVTRMLKIIPAQLAENAVPLGAVSLVIKKFFEQM
jgi:predicted NBD/HSP70 family sugar kinase